MSSHGPRDTVVLITGTTGTLGSAILAKLAALPSVSKIYAVNRVQTGGDGLEERQRRAFATRGLSVTAEAQRKIVQVPAVLHQPDLGVSPGLIKEMQHSVTVIIHNAWPVNFNIPLSAFRESLEGTRNLISFALNSSRPTPRFIFISTTATINNAKLDATATETTSTSPSDAMDNGYSKSKWIAESLIARVAPEFGTVVRVGVVSGAPNGAWDSSHWVPAMLAASKVVGSVPVADTSVSWIPLASAATAITDIVLAPSPVEKAEVLHLIHPRPVQWSTLLQHLPNVKLEDFTSWVRRLEQSDGSEEMVKPALRLLDFFRDMRDRAQGAKEEKEREKGAYDGFMVPRLDMSRMLAVSPSLRNLAPLGEEDVRGWLASSS